MSGTIPLLTPMSSWHGFDHKPKSRAKVKNEWSYTTIHAYTPSWHAQGQFLPLLYLTKMAPKYITQVINTEKLSLFLYTPTDTITTYKYL